jgi:hypothetical protein
MKPERRRKIMQKAYSGKPWENYPSENTPLDQDNLNKIHTALDEVDNRVINLDTTKSTKVEVSTLISDVDFNESTGVITFTRKNGGKVTFDTKLEKLAVNFSYDPTTEQLIITLDDGTVQYVDMSALITVYEFLNSDTIGLTVVDGKVRADVLEGSIQEKHLRPDYLADIKVQQEIAATQAANSAASASEAYTEANRAKTEADRAEQYSNVVAPDFVVDTETMTLYMKGGVGVDFIMEDGVLYWKVA